MFFLSAVGTDILLTSGFETVWILFIFLGRETEFHIQMNKQYAVTSRKDSD